jgi:glutaredoxin-related protein
MIVLFILLSIVLYIYTFKEGLNVTYKQIKDQISMDEIKDQTSYVEDNTECIYTEINPQIATVYNYDYQNIYDVTQTNQSNSNNLFTPYYSNRTFDVDICMNQESLNYVKPFSKNYTYCEISNNIPTCSVVSCGLDKKTHNYKVAELLESRKNIKQNMAMKELSEERKRNSQDYTSKMNTLNNYIFF